MTRTLLRMQRSIDDLHRPTPSGFRIDRYEPRVDRHRIPDVFGSAFDKEPWPDDWDAFDEFDPDGVYVAVDEATEQVVGFAISFPRSDFGYVSVVAVNPAFQRLGLASALVASAVRYLQSLELEVVRIDAWEDSRPAVLCYEGLGFEVYEVRREEDDG